MTMKPLVHFQNSLLTPQTPVAVACSGGVDSMVLSHLCLNYLKKGLISELALFHIDHGQHSKSQNISYFVKEWGDTHRIPVFIESLTLTPRASENTLRVHRYKAFAKLWTQWSPQSQQQNSPQLALAHHAQDQLETYLFRLLRGAHPSSLKGIQPESTLEGLRLVRPLLTQSKEKIIVYAQTHHVPWQEDPTNQSTAYARNAIRQKLLPVLEELRPRSSEKFLKFFEDLSDLQKLKPEVALSPHMSRWDIRDINFEQTKIYIETLLGEKRSHVRQSHWLTLKKVLHSGLKSGAKKTVQFPGGFQVVIHQKTLSFLQGKT